MSCDRDQRQTAETAPAAGISRSGSTAAGVAGRNGQIGGRASGRKEPRRRSVRRAVKQYQRLPVAQKEQLWAALGEVALSRDGSHRRQQLRQAVRRYGGGVVAAALAAETDRVQRNGDDGSRQRYRQVSCELADAVAEVRAETKTQAAKNPAVDQRKGKKSSPEQPPKRAKTEKPTARLKLSAAFSGEELTRLRLLTLLGSAAVRRQLQMLQAGASRGIGHSDPRPQDWLEQDLQNFQLLSRQLKNGDALDIAGLNKANLVDLWEFARFEADRALRNIDHLQSGWSHLKGETAAWLTRDHRLEARFFTWLADQLEPRITPEMRDEYGAVEI